jgi:glycosyltransferase involved in cell wall biosynthesis
MQNDSFVAAQDSHRLDVLEKNSDAIRVLHVITGLQGGGAEMMLYKLLRRIDRERFSNVVLSLTSSGEIGSRISSLGIPCYDLGIEGVGGGVRGLRRAVKLIREFRPNVIQTWLHHADLFGTVAGRLAGNRNIIWNLRCSSLSPNDFPKSSLRLVRILALLSSIPKAVIANSVAGKSAHAQAGYHPGRWEIIPNGFDTEFLAPNRDARIRLRRELGLDDSVGLIGIVGRYHPMKAHALFLQAAAKLAETRPTTRFLMVGRGLDKSNGELMEQIRRLRLESHVLLLGERRDIPDLMSALDILTSASTSGEGFPNVVGEAMSCGLPCVGTDVGDTRAIIGDTGLVVAGGDSEALAGAWDELLAMRPDDRQLLGVAARARIEDSFEIGVIARRYQQLYEGVARAS